MMDVDEVGTLDPTIRRKTAPTRFPPLKFSDNVGVVLEKEKVEYLHSAFGLEDCVAAAATDAASVTEEPYSELTLRVVKSKPVKLLNFKENCKFEINPKLKMEMQFESLNIYGEPCENPKEAKKYTGPRNSVYLQEERKEAKLKRTIDYKSAHYKERVSLNVKEDDKEQEYKMTGTEVNMNEVKSSYYVMSLMDGIVYAHPVENVFDFRQQLKYQTLTDDEVIEAFDKRRSKIMNYFAYMNSKRLKTEGVMGEEDLEEESKKMQVAKKSYELEYMDSTDCKTDDSDEDLVGETIAKFRKKRKRKVRKRDENFDYGTAGVESSDSDDELESGRYLCGVDGEKGLQSILLSDDSEEEKIPDYFSIKTSPQKKKRGRKPDPNKKLASRNKGSGQGQLKTVQVPLVLKRDAGGDWNVRTKIKIERKRKIKNPSSPASADEMKQKKQKNIDPQVIPEVLAKAISEGVTEAEIKRYLCQRPFTAAELLKKMTRKLKVIGSTLQSSEINSVIGHHVEKLGPTRTFVGENVKLYIPTPCTTIARSDKDEEVIALN